MVDVTANLYGHFPPRLKVQEGEPQDLLCRCTNKPYCRVRVVCVQKPRRRCDIGVGVVPQGFGTMVDSDQNKGWLNFRVVSRLRATCAASSRNRGRIMLRLVP